MNDPSQPEQVTLNALDSRPPLVSFTSSPRQPHPQQLSSASSYASLDYLFGVQDIKMLAPKPNRNRRKPSGNEHKHRRTRSGCYTCRSRRVKCDEAHPTCERCKKGGRECIYPEPSSKASGSSSSKGARSTVLETPDSSSGEEDGDGDFEALEAIPDEDEGIEEGVTSGKASRFGTSRRGSSQPSIGPRSSTRHGSETPSLVQDKGSSPTPSTEGSVGYSAYQTLGSIRQPPKFPDTSRPENLKSDWSHLPPDLQYYLAYFYENITYLHFSLKNDPGNFLHTQFLDAALRNDALLHAVVGFSAFQRTLHNPEGRIEDFLPYYNKAVSLLLLSLKRGERHDTGIMLAILQLATIEEFLGDWVNLLGHQKAAFEILTEIYTPQTIMESQMTRTIISWYMRFDVFAGLLGGFQTVLSREWFSYGHEYFREQVIKEPQNLEWRIEAALWQYRLLATDMSLLFSRMGKGEITREQFVVENEHISTRIEEWKTKMDPALQDSRYLVQDFNDAKPLDPDNIIDPYAPGVLYSGPLWVMNVATLDWYSIDIMHRYQSALIMGAQPSPDIAGKAYASCQLFEAIELWPESPPGTIVCLQASVGIAFLFLPRDDRHAMWARRKLATIECNGYIYPYTFRTKMADLFRDRDCMNWWLPNDERYPTIVRSIRKFVEERTAPAKDLPSEDLRDMKAIFSSLNLDDGEVSQPSGTGGRIEGEESWQDTEHMQHMGGEGGYGVAFGEDQDFWQESQGVGDFGIPEPRGFP